MNQFREFLKALIPHIETQAERDEAYLAQAIDIYDLERRMEELDRRRRGARPFPSFAEGLR